jgi:hypothetical protein
MAVGGILMLVDLLVALIGFETNGNYPMIQKKNAKGSWISS